MARAKDILFRVFYSTSFTFVFLLLIVFICASPIDTVYQSLRRDRLIDIFLLSGTYFVTGLIATLIYSSRLYTNRSVLKEIPKTYMPVDKEDLPTKKTHRFIAQILARSAIIAYQAKPRSNRLEHELLNANDRIAAALKPELGKVEGNVHFAREQENIQHRGFSSPAASQLPDLEYAVVVAELVDLIEAKAVSLAPIDPMSTPGLDGTPIPDSRVVAILTRSNTAGMREYLGQLVGFGVIPNTSLVILFLSHYERARFGPLPLSEPEFQTLMRMFAELLRSMEKPSAEALDLVALSDGVGEGAREAQYNGSIRSSSISYRGGSSSSINNNNNKAITRCGPQDRPSSQRTTSTLSNPDSVLHNMPSHTLPRHTLADSVPFAATEDDGDNNESINAVSKTGRPSRSSATAVSALRQPSRTNTSLDAGSPRTPSLHQTDSQNSLADSLRSTVSAKSRSARSVRSVYSGASNAGSVIVRLTSDEERARTGSSLPFAIEMPGVDRGRDGIDARPARSSWSGQSEV